MTNKDHHCNMKEQNTIRTVTYVSITDRLNALFAVRNTHTKHDSKNLSFTRRVFNLTFGGPTKTCKRLQFRK
jgi:hypothetical protein